MRRTTGSRSQSTTRPARHPSSATTTATRRLCCLVHAPRTRDASHGRWCVGPNIRGQLPRSTKLRRVFFSDLLSVLPVGLVGVTG
eukprot:1900631-Prymnesium_polylepis.1